MARHLEQLDDPEPLHRHLAAIDEPGAVDEPLEIAGGLLTDRRCLETWLDAFGATSSLPWVALTRWHLARSDEQARLVPGAGVDAPRIRSLVQEHLRRAEEAAWTGHLADDADPLPWVPTLATGNRLGIRIEERIARKDRLDRHGITFASADHELLTGLAAKAGGDDALMFAYARRLAEGPGATADRVALVLVAHVERLVADQDPHLRELHRSTERTREEVATFARQVFDTAAGTPVHARPIALNAATVAASLFGLNDLVAEGHRRIGEDYRAFPWVHAGAGTAEANINADRQRVGLAPLA
jgi:hypothetical protein